MDSLIDNLSTDQWQEVDADNKGDGFKDYFLSRGHVAIDKNTLGLLITDDDDNALQVKLPGLKEGKNPFSGIGRCEIRVEGENITGIDLNGDCVVRK